MSFSEQYLEETGRIVDYHNARVYVLEPTGDLVPIAFAVTVPASKSGARRRRPRRWPWLPAERAKWS